VERVPTDLVLSRVAALMRTQHAVLHRRQALGCGMTAREVERRLATRAWQRVHREVYAAAGTAVTHQARCWAAWLAVRYGARDRARYRHVAVAGAAAAVLQGMAQSAAHIELVVPLGTWAPPLRGVRVRRLRQWGEIRVTRVEGLPVTSRHDTAARMAALLRDDDDLLTILQEELFHRRTTMAKLASRRRKGRAGSARLGRVLAVLATGADSALHVRGRSVLVGAGMPKPDCGQELIDGTGDTDCFVARRGATGPPWGYVIEWDGALHRTSRRKYRFGLWKRRRLENGGYPVFRFTTDDVDDPAEMIAAVLAEDARQRALPPEGDGRALAG